MYQELTISEMTREQLVSFLAEKLDPDYWYTDFLTLDTLDGLLKDLSFDGSTLEERFPDKYVFFGNNFFESKEDFEEHGYQYTTIFLPLLGHSRVYFDLKRIVYWDEDFSEIKRISFVDYEQQLNSLSSQIETVKKFLKEDR